MRRSAGRRRTSAASSAWSWVMTSTWVPGGSSASTSSGSTGTWCTWIRGHARRRATASALGGELLGAGVDEVQVEVVAGQDAGQLQADVAHAEDRDGGTTGSGSSRTRHLAAAALRRRARPGALSDSDAVSVSGVAPAPGSEQRGPGRRPPPRGCRRRSSPTARRPQTTILAPASRGAWPRTAASVTSTPGRRCSRRCSTRVQPVHFVTRSPGRAASAPRAVARAASGWRPAGPGSTPGAARRRDASVSRPRRAPARPPSRPPRAWPGEARSTLTPAGPNAAAACRSASRTEKASISGGSPTALEP